MHFKKRNIFKIKYVIEDSKQQHLSKNYLLLNGVCKIYTNILF